MFFVGVLWSMAKADSVLLLALPWSQRRFFFFCRSNIATSRQEHRCSLAQCTGRVARGSERPVFFHAAEPVTVTMKNIEEQ
jgi:hypothetical protein